MAMLMSLLLSAPAAAQAAEYTLNPVQPSVEAGAIIDFTGSGFTQGERVVTWATTPSQAVIGGNYADAKDAAGNITFNFRVPANAVGGRWAMTAYGLISKTPVVATFEVISQAPDTSPQAAVAPQSGPAGTRFTFVAIGYKKKEKVSYWLTAPDGKVYAAYPEGATTNSGGRVDIVWSSPANAPSGSWAITIQSLKSNVVRAVPFEISP
jgi:hypothetical protein